MHSSNADECKVSKKRKAPEKASSYRDKKSASFLLVDFFVLNIMFYYFSFVSFRRWRGATPNMSFCRFSVCRQNDVFFLYFYPVARWRGFALARATFFRPASKEGKGAPLLCRLTRSATLQSPTRAVAALVCTLQPRRKRQGYSPQTAKRKSLPILLRN